MKQMSNVVEDWKKKKKIIKIFFIIILRIKQKQKLKV